MSQTGCSLFSHSTRIVIEELEERLRMDRRRLDDGFLLYWCLKRVQEYGLGILSKISIPAEVDDLVAVVWPLFHDAFIKNGYVSKLLVGKSRVFMTL